MKDIVVVLIFLLGVGVNAQALEASLNLLQALEKGTSQAIIVREISKEDSQAELTAWQKKDTGWELAQGPMPAVVGRNGLAALNEKKEGDGKTPSGMFKIQRAFGYERGVETKLNYFQVDENDFWVDDVDSPDYNRWVKEIKEGTRSFERLKRDDDLYKYAIVIEYNTDPVVPGNGSAIFLHIWRGAGSPTSGCVAVSKENILKLLEWLDTSQEPVVLIGQQAVGP